MAKIKDPALSKAISCSITRLREGRYPGHGGKKKCALDFGIHPQVWRDWESGHRTPGPAYQKKLAAFFGISIAQLRDEADKGDPVGEAPGDGDSLVADLMRRNAELEREVERLTRENNELRGVVNHLQSQSMLQIYDNTWIDRV